MLVLNGYLLIFFVKKVTFDAHGVLHAMEHANNHAVVVPSTKSNINNQRRNNNHKMDQCVCVTK